VSVLEFVFHVSKTIHCTVSILKTTKAIDTHMPWILICKIGISKVMVCFLLLDPGVFTISITDMLLPKSVMHMTVEELFDESYLASQPVT
jgi:hypothetical protein